MQLEQAATGYKKPETAHEAFLLTEDFGYMIEKLTPTSSGNDIVWDIKSNRFALIDSTDVTKVIYSDPTIKLSDDPVHLWKIFKEKPTGTFKYSVYLAGTGMKGSIEDLRVGLDVGLNVGITSVEYDRSFATEGQTVVFRTNSVKTSLLINAPLDSIKHYGEGSIVDITAVAQNSYHENGSFSKAIIKQGRVVIESSGNIPSFEIAAVPTLTKPIIIETDKDVVVSANDSVIAALEGDKLENVQITVSNPNANVVVDDNVDLSKVTATGKTQEDFVTIEKVGTYTQLQTALQASKKYIKLTSNISYLSNGVGLINITHSMTLDGDGYQISGYGTRDRSKTTVAINHNSTTMVDVTLKNLKILNEANVGKPVETRGSLRSLTLDTVIIEAKGTGNNQGLTIGGNQSSNAVVNIYNSEINAKLSGYAIIIFNPVTMNITNSELNAWASIYFKGMLSSAGSRGSIVTATKTQFYSPNIHEGSTNDFAAFQLEDDGISITLFDCGINANEQNVSNQSAFGIYTAPQRKDKPISVVLNGITTITGEIVDHDWRKATHATLVINGGLYSVDPSEFVSPDVSVVKSGVYWQVQ